jgi:hypothetical protein
LKKEAKTFFKLGRAGVKATGPEEVKIFCAAFFQKSGCFLDSRRSGGVTGRKLLGDRDGPEPSPR